MAVNCREQASTPHQKHHLRLLFGWCLQAAVVAAVAGAGAAAAAVAPAAAAAALVATAAAALVAAADLVAGAARQSEALKLVVEHAERACWASSSELLILHRRSRSGRLPSGAAALWRTHMRQTHDNSSKMPTSTQGLADGLAGR